MKKIAVFCDFFNEFGGTEYYNYQLIKCLANTGQDVKVFIGERPRNMFWINKIFEINVEVFFPEEFHKSLSDSSIEKKFICIIKSFFHIWKPEIIHAHPMGKLLTSWMMLEEKDGIKVVATEWTTPNKNTEHWYPDNLKKYINEIDAIIVTCDTSRIGLREFLNYKKNIKYIPHLLHPCSEEFELSKEKNHSMGCISRLSPEKGLVFLLGAWKKVVDLYPDSTLHIYGDGNEYGSLVLLTKALGIKDNVFFEKTFTPITGIDEIAKKHNVFIQPSLFESIPTSIIELMMRKRIVITTNVGGIPEIINSGHTNGIMVNPGSTEEIYDAIIKILSDISYISERGINTHQQIISKYNLSENIKKILNVYDEISI